MCVECVRVCVVCVERRQVYSQWVLYGVITYSTLRGPSLHRGQFDGCGEGGTGFCLGMRNIFC